MHIQSSGKSLDIWRYGYLNITRWRHLRDNFAQFFFYFFQSCYSNLISTKIASVPPYLFSTSHISMPTSPPLHRNICQHPIPLCLIYLCRHSIPNFSLSKLVILNAIILFYIQCRCPIPVYRRGVAASGSSYQRVPEIRSVNSTPPRQCPTNILA